MLSTLADLPAGWYQLADRVPRRDQVVRVLTHRGTDHRAQFAVAHTEDWPSGASWVVAGATTSLAFAEVTSWSPDPDAVLPRLPPKADRVDRESGRPAILNEVLIEVERTGTLLRLLPDGQLDWSPHPDISSPRQLAQKIVRLVDRIGWILDLDRLDVEFEPDLPSLGGSEEAVQGFGENETAVQRLVVGLDAAALRAPWILERGGRAIARLPRGDALRTFGLTPLVYTRGELALLLTALGVEIPSPTPLWPLSGFSPAL